MKKYFDKAKLNSLYGKEVTVVINRAYYGKRKRLIEDIKKLTEDVLVSSVDEVLITRNNLRKLQTILYKIEELKEVLI